MVNPTSIRKLPFTLSIPRGGLITPGCFVCLFLGQRSWIEQQAGVVGKARKGWGMLKMALVSGQGPEDTGVPVALKRTDQQSQGSRPWEAAFIRSCWYESLCGRLGRQQRWQRAEDVKKTYRKECKMWKGLGSANNWKPVFIIAKTETLFGFTNLGLILL